MNIYCFSVDDLEPNSLAVIPGMGIPEQLKIAMEQEQMGTAGRSLSRRPERSRVDWPESASPAPLPPPQEYL